jgi:acyl-CoA thioesterase-1
VRRRLEAAVLAVLLAGALACGTDDAGWRSTGSTGDLEAAPAAAPATAGPDGAQAGAVTDGAGGDARDGAAGSAAPRAPGESDAGDRRERPRIVFLGTSLTSGLGLLRREERFTSRLQELADSAGIPARMVNQGVSGETSAGGLRRLEWVLENPVDVLVVELGANDGLRGQDPGAMEENLRGIVRRTRARHPEARIVLVGMEAPPNLGEAYTRRFREAFAAVAADYDLTFVPFLLEGVAGRDALNQDDRIHPNAEGHRAIARSLWPVLEPVLREAAEAGRPGGGSR